jgi:hypothetical protein
MPGLFGHPRNSGLTFKVVEQLGPWAAGLDTEIDPDSLPVNAMQKLVNLIVTQAGTLKERPSVTSHLLPSKGFPSFTTNLLGIKSLGSVVDTATGQLTAFACASFGAYDSVNAWTNYTVKFYKYTAGNSWVKAWDDVTLSNYPGLPSGLLVSPNSVLYYNGFYYVLGGSAQMSLFRHASTTGTLTNYTASGGFLTATSTFPWGISPSSSNPCNVLGFVMLKDRMVVIDPYSIYCSGVGNPTYWNTTLAQFGVPAATGIGYQLITQKETGETTNAFIVFNGELYIATSSSVWKFSWTIDPSNSGDGIFKKISDEIGGVDFEIWNNELFLLNRRGLYRLVNNYFTEVSGPVRSQFRGGALDAINGKGTSFLSQPIPQYGLGLNKVGHYLLCGPLNDGITMRGNEVITDARTGNFYLVYNLDTGVWSSWQFSANAWAGPISGPTEKPMLVGVDPSAPSEIVWFGQTTYLFGVLATDAQSPRLQAPFGMMTTDLTNTLTESNGIDYGCIEFGGAPVNQWKGSIFKTGNITLGVPTRWKRIFNCLMDVVFTNNIVFQAGGTSTLGFEIDNAVTPAPTVVVDEQNTRLTLGGGYRFRKLAIVYDSITGVYQDLTHIQFAELQDLSNITMEMASSQKNIE